MVRKFRFIALVLAGLSVFAIAACSSGGDESSDAEATTAPGAEGTVAVVLKEFSIAPDADEVAAGEVTFDVSNAGALPHEFIVIKTDTSSADLPVTAVGADLTGLEEVGRIDQFNAGEEKSLTVDMEAGHYVLICNIAGHFAGGMHTDFTVN